MPSIHDYKHGRQPIKEIEAKKLAAQGVAGIAEVQIDANKTRFIALFGLTSKTYDFYLASYRDESEPRQFRRIDPIWRMLKRLGFKRFVVELNH